MGLNWISSNEIRNYFPTSEDLIGAAGDFSICKTPGKTNQWMKKQSFICQQGEGDTWALVHTSKQLQQNGATVIPQRKKKVAWQGDVFLLGMQPQPQTQQASYYWWYDGQNPAPLEMITCTSKISTIPSAAGILPSRVAFEHCSTENSKKLPLPKKTLMWITATYHQWNHPVDFVFVSRANKSQKDNQ